MKTAAVIIDKWKLPIFTKYLREAGFSYDTCDAELTANTLTLKVKFESVTALQLTIMQAQDECARSIKK